MMTNKTFRILIVEDDRDLANLLQYNLEKAGMEPRVASTGETAIEMLGKIPFGMAILDIMLPGMDGLSVCRHIRQVPATKQMYVMMLTAKGEEVDRVVGFELGADDYMVKPFSPRELVLRVKAAFRRSHVLKNDEDVLESNGIVIEPSAHRLKVNGKDISLTPMEFKLLVTLMRRSGRVQSRETLLIDVWGIDADVYTRTVDTHVRRLRDKLGRPGAVIETVAGVGYRFKDQDDE